NHIMSTPRYHGSGAIGSGVRVRWGGEGQRYGHGGISPNGEFVAVDGGGVGAVEGPHLSAGAGGGGGEDGHPGGLRRDKWSPLVVVRIQDLAIAFQGIDRRCRGGWRRAGGSSAHACPSLPRRHGMA